MGIACIIAGMVLRYFYVQQQLREQEQSELQSRIQALQSRIRPHFLFNSMNIIASLISVDPETAETVVEDLSELFRASLNDAGNQVLMTEELELCERYVRIERLRLGDRLRVAWDIGEYPAELKIPLLTLQPLLENAIYHGIQPLPDGGTIALTLRYDHNVVSVRITNPLPAPELRTPTQGNKMAVNNIRTRLNVLYNGAAELTAEIEGDLYVTHLRYPHPALEGEMEPIKEVS
jgi:two-component system sensor histidine kinase AlgZ